MEICGWITGRYLESEKYRVFELMRVDIVQILNGLRLR